MMAFTKSENNKKNGIFTLNQIAAKYKKLFKQHKPTFIFIQKNMTWTIFNTDVVMLS